MCSQRSAARKGFSLVEILIVVTIIGILAAIAIPKFANASQIARESSLKEDLRTLRTQLSVYRTQHRDVFPGYPGGSLMATPTAQATADQLTMYTDADGHTSATGNATQSLPPLFPMIPPNPVNGKATFTIVDVGGTFTATGATGWLYQPSTGQLKADTPGNDSAGRAFTDY